MDTMTHYITVVDDNVEAGYAAATAVAEVLGYVTDVLGTATIQHKGYRVVLHASSRHFASVKAENGFWYKVDIRWDWNAEREQFWILTVRRG